MLIKKAPDIRSSEITPKSLFVSRRAFLQTSAAALVAAGVASYADRAYAQQGGGLPKIANVKKMGAPFTVNETPTSYADFTSWNNYYEFGTGKDDPKANSKKFKPKPWKIKVEGMVAKPAEYDIDDFIKPYQLEERVYRFRCVEAWSAVVPWIGIPLKSVVDRLQPTSKAKYIEFTTLYDTGQYPYQREDILPWPYLEGLRLDEARNELSLLSVGMYGEELPNQSGAPIRLITPWKYGFKGAKAIVKMKFTDKQPRNTWQVMASNEYGFYANVNPMVDHPRWSQARERRLGEFRYRPTLMFNGYEKEVASLYAGMDLRKNY
jgi:sulfoxide reductase catalytic subunit YedY